MKKFVTALACVAVLGSALSANECICFELKGEFGEEIKAIMQKYSKTKQLKNEQTLIFTGLAHFSC